ncbi:hypothetical protein BVY00_00275 [bacterium G20]|nr:hypothetical protein BVY00_00275 [bacterium G20]
MDMPKLFKRPGKLTDDAFRVSLYLKGLDGLLELFGGILLLIVNPEQINHFARAFTQHELSSDPHDFIANHILKSTHELTGASLIFGAAYLLSHGIVKLVLIVEVLRDHLWAYKALIGVTAAFVVYQLYRMAFKFSIGLLLLTIFDLIIIYLTTVEYKKHKIRHESQAEN